MLAAHLGDRAKGAQSIAAFGDLQISEMLGCDAQALRIIQGSDRGRAKYGAMLIQWIDQAISQLGYFITTKHADKRIDFRPGFEQLLTLAAPPGNLKRSRPGSCLAV